MRRSYPCCFVYVYSSKVSYCTTLDRRPVRLGISNILGGAYPRREGAYRRESLSAVVRCLIRILETLHNFGSFQHMFTSANSGGDGNSGKVGFMLTVECNRCLIVTHKNSEY